ncbi:MAG: DUF5329 family protein [Spirochaetes bacterium]|nr:DUF5329 family protein [Spirochaetota bacterium]MBN2770613.1 DUF5329 family protein [Spirochaetota bacterium]
MKNILILMLFLTTSTIAEEAAKNDMSEEQKINYLIQCVINLKDAQFVRNGKSYDSIAAGNHLKMKREKAGTRIKTVNDFIEKLASRSLLSGKPYLIIYKSGREIDAETFYRQCLARLK